MQRLKGIFQTLDFRPTDCNTMPSRRADIDWLRIGLFGLLILHHVGMFYVLNWGWHAKSSYRAEWLESILLIVEPWRMPAIWLVSGMAIRYVLAKVSLRRFIALRSLRLLLPLLFGVWVVVPPQLFVEMSAKGEISMGYWQFLQAFFQFDHPLFANYAWGLWPHIDVNHLWYLRSLWYYSMWMIPLLPLLNHRSVATFMQWLFTRHGAVILATLCIPIVVLQVFWKVNDIRYPIGFLFLLYGYLLGWYAPAWQKIQCSLRTLSLTYAIVAALLIANYNLIWIDLMQGAEVAFSLQLPVLLSYSLARILGVGYGLSSRSLGPVTEPLLLTTLTLLLCFGMFEVIRRTEWLRPFFGLKLRGRYSHRLQQAGYLAGGLLIAPVVWALVF